MKTVLGPLLIPPILLAAGQIIKCMNFYGLETPRPGLVCDWQNPPTYYLDILVGNMSINTIRLPFSYEFIKWGKMETIDSFITACDERNVQVILDYHRTWSSHQGPQPEEGITREEFLKAWEYMVTKYASVPTVMGIGIFNEYQGEDINYLSKMQNEVIQYIEKLFPKRFNYFLGCPKWGGDCSKMNLGLYKGIEPSRLFVEVHKYIFSGTSNEADWDKSMPRSIPPDRWFIGEVGWKNNIPEERLWAETFLAYLNKRNISNVCAWTIAHSGDTEGWWKDDCITFDYSKAALLNGFWDHSLKRTRESNFLANRSYVRCLQSLRATPL